MKVLNQIPLKFKHLLSALLLLVSMFAYSQAIKTPSVDFTHNDISNTTTKNLYVRSESLPSCFFGVDYAATNEIKSAILEGKISLGEEYLFGNAAANNFTWTVHVDIKGYAAFSGTATAPLFTAGGDLTINTASNTYKPEQTFAIDFTAVHKDINRFDVTVTLVSSSGNTTITQNALNVNVNYKEVFGYKPSVDGWLTLNQVSPVASNPVTFTWNPECENTPAPNYEFQLLRVYNIDPSKTDETDIYAMTDWSQALDIETGNGATQITLNITEGTGYYVWRVRPIGNYYEGGIANSANWGKWSDAGSRSTGYPSIFNPGFLTSDCFFYNQFDDDKNWTYSRTFVEGDTRDDSPVTISEQISYSNSLQMEKQNQVKLNTENKILVNQVIQDFSGRPVLTTMAAPVDQSYLGYKEGFIKNNSTTPTLYTASDFDTDTKYKDPSPITASPVTDYYSNANTDATIPNAEGYAFYRTLYFRDGTNRPKEQSGPGTAHALKPSGTLVNNIHTLRTSYASVADGELVRLFGDEAPADTSVYKEITMDANNSSTIAYISKEGQTIATCMSQPGSAQLDALSSQSGGGFIVTDQIRGNTLYGDNGFTASKNVSFTQATQVTLNYDITPDTYQDACSSICESCDYNISFYIHRVEDGYLEYSNTVAVSPSGCSPAPTSISTSPVTVSLAAGDYIIERRIEALTTNTVTGNTYLDDQAAALTTELQTLFNGDAGDGYLTDVTGTTVGTAKDMTTINGYIAVNDIDGLNTYLEATTEDTKKYIKLGCDVIEIPIQRCPKNNCSPVAFEEMLFARWGSIHGNNLNTYMPEYATGAFNTMIGNMLAFTNPQNSQPYYTCDQLSACWESLVETYDNMNDLYSDLGTNNSGVTPTNPGLLKSFLNCTGYHLQGFSNTATGTNGYLSEPYAYFNYTAGAKPACEGAFCATSTCTTTEFNDFDENEWYNFSQCVSTVSGTPGTAADIIDIAEKNIDDCKDVCESRYESFLSALVSEYNEHAINVEGFPSRSFSTTAIDDFIGNNLVGGTNYSVFLGDIMSSITPPIDPTYFSITESGGQSFVYDSDLGQFVSSAGSTIDLNLQTGSCNLTFANNATGVYAHYDAPIIPAPGIPVSQVYCQARMLVEQCKSQCQLTITSHVDGGSGQTVIDQVGTPVENQSLLEAVAYNFELELPDGSGNCSAGFDKIELAVSKNKIMEDYLNRELNTFRNNVGINGDEFNYLQALETFNPGIDVLGCYNNMVGNPTVFVGREVPSSFTIDDGQSSIQTDYHPECVDTGAPNYSLEYIVPRAIIPGETFEVTVNIIVQNDIVEERSKYNLNIDPTTTLNSGSHYEIISNISNPLLITYSGPVLPQGSIINTYSFLVKAPAVIPTAEHNFIYQVFTCDPTVTNVLAYGPWLRHQFNISSSCAISLQYKAQDAANVFLCNDMCEAPSACDPICLKWIAPTLPDPNTNPDIYTDVTPVGCDEQSAGYIKSYLAQQIDQIIDNRVASLKESYKNKCINSATLLDHFTSTYPLGYYHYTLYYYDRAGNLVKTVPPNGVDLSSTTRAQHPAHTFVTEYWVNSLKQIKRQSSPDGGETRFWYNNKGQLRFSQNAKQLAAGANTYSYSKYDKLGRIIEVGELNNADTTQINSLAYPSTGVTQVTRTTYTSPNSFITYQGQGQRYLQNRVSYSISDPDGILFNTDEVYTFFSYDPHGNVEWMYNYQSGLNSTTVAYEYDLISGSMLKVKYNEGKVDQFFHRYTYDADKRIKTVETSRDGYVWDNDANYKYYPHGPLKRTEIGEDKIQGIDYVYTIQGWLKGINHSSLDENLDPSQDGKANTPYATTAKDVYGTMLSYFSGDFNRTINSTESAYNSIANTANTYHLQGDDLFNGNISSWTNHIACVATGAGNKYEQLTGNKYRYDELNRIKKSDFLYYDNGTFNAVTEYGETFNYDANGNITSLFRNTYNTAGNTQMDDLTYHYIAGTNKLLNVQDDVIGNAETTDIKTQLQAGNTATVNYTYDETGNLKSDVAGNISNIEWNVYGKIKTITKTGAQAATINYYYDAAGRRIRKQVTDGAGTVTTYYVLDATGNQLAVYTQTGTGAITMVEQPIYGMERIGANTKTATIVTNAFTGSATPVIEVAIPGAHIDVESPIYVPVSASAVVNMGFFGTWTIPLSGEKQLITSNATATNSNFTIPSTDPLYNVSYFTNQGRGAASIADGTGQSILRANCFTTWDNQELCGVYDQNNLLLINSSGILAGANTQCALIKIPTETDKYYLFTIHRGVPYYHVIDMAIKKVISKNQLVYAGAQSVPIVANTMKVLEDLTGNGASQLYIQGVWLGQHSVVAIPILSNGMGAIKSLYTMPSGDATKDVEMEISPSGNEMVVANNKGSFVTFMGVVLGTLQGEIKRFKLDGVNHDILTPLSTLPLGNKVRASSLVYNTTGTKIYYKKENLNGGFASLSSGIYQTSYALSGGGLVMFGNVGDIRRGVNGKIYAPKNAANTHTMYVITEPNSVGSISDAAANYSSAITSTLKGSMPLYNHIITDDVTTTQLGTPYAVTASLYTRELNGKEYDLKDHLSNVRVQVSDMKLWTDANSNNTPDGGEFTADVISYTNYTAFGAVQSKRSYNNSKRGFGNQEKDDEIYGAGNAYTAEYWEYDPRLGRRWNVDPVVKPWESSYAAFANNPIYFNDIFGLDPDPPISGGDKIIDIEYGGGFADPESKGSTFAEKAGNFFSKVGAIIVAAVVKMDEIISKDDNPYKGGGPLTASTETSSSSSGLKTSGGLKKKDPWLVKLLNWIADKTHSNEDYSRWSRRSKTFNLPIYKSDNQVPRKSTDYWGNTTPSRPVTGTIRHKYKILVSTWYYVEFNLKITDKNGKVVYDNYNEVEPSWENGNFDGYSGQPGDSYELTFPKGAQDAWDVNIREHWWNNIKITIPWFPQRNSGELIGAH